jgi:hypothetical protein
LALGVGRACQQEAQEGGQGFHGNLGGANGNIWERPREKPVTAPME